MKVKRTPPLLKWAIIALAAAPFVTAAGMLQQDPDTKRALLFLAAGFFVLGFGEILNHPPQTDLNYTEHLDSELRLVHHRRRNPCVLGNLLFISGMIFLFMSLSHVISF